MLMYVMADVSQTAICVITVKSEGGIQAGVLAF